MITEKQKKIIKNELMRSRLKAEIKESVLKTIREEPNYMDSAGEKAQVAAMDREISDVVDVLGMIVDRLQGTGIVSDADVATLEAAIEILRRASEA